LPVSISQAQLDEILQRLLMERSVFLHHDFFSLHNNPLLAYRRKGGNKRAEKLLPKAYRVGRFLYRFPFVKAIGISGSLSKNFADEKADIDFFIITRANRLWIARTIMHLFKKLTFITGHQHYFCMNYYVDEEAMLIEPKNIFTAMETVTLLPVAGKKILKQFFEINEWTCHFFPSVNPAYATREADGDSQPWYKKIMEGLFNGRLFDHLDNWLLKITAKRWQRKTNNGVRNKNGHTMQLETGKHFCRSNPSAFQEKVLALYERKLDELKIDKRD
jgi:hypothetical protein